MRTITENILKFGTMKEQFQECYHCFQTYQAKTVFVKWNLELTKGFTLPPTTFFSPYLFQSVIPSLISAHFFVSNNRAFYEGCVCLCS